MFGLFIVNKLQLIFNFDILWFSITMRYFNIVGSLHNKYVKLEVPRLSLMSSFVFTFKEYST